MMGKMVWARLASVAASLALAALAFPSFNDEVSMAVEPVWGAGAPVGQVVPIRVTIQNDGPDRTGVVEARGLGMSRVTVDMPRDSQKEVILYPAASGMGFESVEVTLSTQGGQIRVPVETQSVQPGDQTMGVIALISDTLGGFSFLRNSTYKGTRFTDIYLKPGAALDRAVGYQSANLIVLGDGAERLTDREVSALKRYVLMGGALVFMGGSSAPILRDDRWADILPIKNPRATSLASVGYLNQFEEVPGGSVSIMNVDPKERATSVTQGGTTILTKRAFGLGTVFVLGFNLTDQPLSKWTGRLQLFNSLLRESRTQSSMLAQHSTGYMAYIGFDYDDPYGYGHYSGTTGFPGSTPMPSTPTSGGESDPFRAQLPPAGTIFMILAGFWVVVIPIHFFILNRFKKGELAWFTGPIIALGFAGLLFTLASGLYKSGLSTALEGVLFRADGSDEAVFVGKQQLFFPSGGRYDLGFRGVEAVLPNTSRFDYSGRTNPSDTSFQNDLHDIGEVVAPKATTTNLNFKEFRLAERRTEAWTLPAEITVSRQGQNVSIKGKITNQSPYKLMSPTIFAAGQWLPSPGDIEPGESRSFNVLMPARNGAPPEIPVSLWARVTGIEAGARIGKAAAGRMQELLYSYGTFKVADR